MDQKLHDDGVLLMLLERFEKHRLPRLLDIHEAVKQGHNLTEMDICFLEESLSTATRSQALIERNPDYEQLFSKIISLYHEITQTALENENK